MLPFHEPFHSSEPEPLWSRSRALQVQSVVPHSQPTTLQQTVCKFHLDPQYHIWAQWRLKLISIESPTAGLHNVYQRLKLDTHNRPTGTVPSYWALLVCDLNRTPNCYGKTWRFLCPFFGNLHLRENLARDCFISTVSTVTNSVQNIFTHLRYCDK